MLIFEMAVAAVLMPSTEAMKSVASPSPRPSIASDPHKAPKVKPPVRVSKVPATPPSVQQSPMPPATGCNWAGCPNP